jgi:PAS domain S-box-containing protein
MIKKYNTPVRYLFALAVVGAGALLRLVMTILVGPGLPTFVTFYPAVMLVALLAGFGPGLLATLSAGLVADLWLIHPEGSLMLEQPVDIVGLAIFICMGAFMSWVAERYRKIRDNLEEMVEARTAAVKERTKDLRESEERLRNLYESMSEGLANHEIEYENGATMDYIITDVNPAFEKITGMSRNDAIGRKASQIYGTGSAPYLDVYSRVAAGGGSVNFETYFPPMEKHFSISVFSPGRGKFATIFSDITERKMSERVLQESEARLNRSQEIAHLGSWELDLAANRLAWSDEVYRIFGIGPQEFGASYDAFLEAVHPDDRAAVDAAYSDSLREGRDTYEIEHRVVRRSDGEIRIVYEKCAHIRDESGKIIRSIGMVHDITERKKAEEEIRKVNENLEQFAYVASHDLQEPLRVMSSFSQLLEKRYRGRLDMDADEFIGFIVDAAARMQKLINDLLAYSRTGHKATDVTEVDCDEVVNRVLKSMALTMQSTGGMVTCDKLPRIRAHEASIMRLFQNLIANALKFHSGDSPRIQVCAVNADNKWIFSVIDNGIGIEPQYHQRIFQMFQRLHAKDRYTGTGMGLAICKKIVENHSGNIWVESEPGKGSTFCFSIPG